MNSTFVGYDEKNTWYNVTLGVGGNFARFSSLYEDEYLLGVFDSIEGNTALYTGGNYCNDLDGTHSGSVRLMEDKTLDFWSHVFEEEHECVNNLIILVPKLCSKEHCLSSRTKSSKTSKSSEPKSTKSSKASKSSMMKPNCDDLSRMNSSKSSKSPEALKCVDFEMELNGKGFSKPISFVLKEVIAMLFFSLAI
jgi:hypothetical protein